jgi:hypothetical protein
VITGAIIVGGPPALSACLDVDHEEWHCENAMSRLQECCAGFEAIRFSCDEFTWNGIGCDGAVPPDRRPLFGPTEADCIERQDCASLNRTGVCARALALTPPSPWDAGPASWGVCP